ncbi:MAG: site-specific DNA-methyltransferase [Candidatus Shapirobacteria bacterium]|jgi:adenine-specific DNA-methyltransferase
MPSLNWIGKEKIVNHDRSASSREKLLAEIDRLKKELKKKKKYGLVWEDKPEDVVEMCKEKLPVLKEVKSKEIITDKNKPMNLLIEGDNYHALSVLNYTHKGKIDVIYIDPPYNTGKKNEFKYNDHWVDKEDSYRHSKWLSFMSKRIRLAKQLLNEEGMFFCSIDDNEMSQLRLLLDEIFGEDNFINCISVKTKSSAGASGGGEDKKLKKHVEYLLFYAKNRETFSYKNVFIGRDLEEIIIEKEDNGKQFEYKQVLVDYGKKEVFETIQDGSGQDIKIFKHSKYEIKSISSLIKGENLTRAEAYNKYFEKIFRGQPAQSSIRTRVNEAINNDKGLFSIEYTPRSGKRKNQIATNYYLKCDLVNYLSDTSQKSKSGKIVKYEKAGSLWADLSWNGLSSEGGVSFENGKKPIAFLKRILQLYPLENPIILDFFAGSGSMGHAVLDMNVEDEQERTVILCANNESNICHEKTYPRMKNVINGFSKKKPLGGNLKYFKTDFVDYKESTDRNKIKLTREAVEMLCVKEGTFESVLNNEDFKIFKNHDHYAGIIFDQLAIANFKKTINDIKGKVSVYIFSLGDDSFEDEFEDIKQKVKLSPIPEAILKVYRRIYK